MSLDKVLNRLTLLSIFSFCLFIYTSIAASSLGHIFLLAPGLYFTYKHWRSFPPPMSARILMGLIIVAAISTLLADNIATPWNRIGALRYYLAGILSIWAFNVAFAHSFKEKHIRLALSLGFIAVSLASISGIIGLFYNYNPLRFREATDPMRATGMYSMAITYGYGIQFMALLTLGLVFARKRLRKYLPEKLLWLALFSCLAGLYFSYTRGAAIGFFTGIPFLFLRLHRKFFITAIAAGFALMVVALIIVFTGGSQNRFLLKANHDSNLIRLSQYEAAYYAFKEKPLLGHGHRQFTHECERIKKQYNIAFPDFISHTHNNYVEYLVNIGIFGALFLLLFHLRWLWEAWKRQDEVGDITMSIVVAMMVSGLFQCTVDDGENAFALMFFYGLSQVTAQRMKAIVESRQSA